MQLDAEEIRSATPEEARAMLREVTSVLPLLVAKASETGTDSDRLLTVEEAAAMLGRNPKVLYRQKDRYPFLVRDGKSVRFSERGIREWIARNGD